VHADKFKIMSYQEYSMPVDVIPTRVDLAADKSVTVPSRVRVDMSLLKRQKSSTSDKNVR